jgi:hypothetical protein
MNIVREETYVFDGVEVKKTGRRAHKMTNIKEPSSGKTRSFELVEITPVDVSGFQWTKWVRESELYVIVQ